MTNPLMTSDLDGLAADLFDGVTADIWYDAASYGDTEKAYRIERTKEAMERVAYLLESLQNALQKTPDIPKLLGLLAPFQEPYAIPGYVVADPDISEAWGHLFEESDNIPSSGERMTRFVWSLAEERIIAAQLLFSTGWVDATPAEIDDLDDSLRNANAEALENPAEYGLARVMDLPEWAGPKQEDPAPSP